MSQPLSIQLPDETLQLLDLFSSNGDRSALINAAIQHYLQYLQTESLREQIKAGAIHRADRDRALTEDWFPLEEEICLNPTA